MHAINAMRLEPPLDQMLCAKRQEFSLVIHTQGDHVSQDHGRDLVTTGQFDLSAMLSTFKRLNQLSERHEQCADMPGQYRA